MKILCNSKPTISDDLMNQFKEDLRQIFKKYGHSMGSFKPKKTYGASIYCKLRIRKSDLLSFEEDFVPSLAEGQKRQLEIKHEDGPQDRVSGNSYLYSTSVGYPFYICSALRDEVDEISDRWVSIINEDFKKLEYAKGIAPYDGDRSALPYVRNEYGNFYMYLDSKVPQKAYDSEYVILSGTLHLYIDPTYEL